MRRIYIASSWRNIIQPIMVDLLRSHGHEVYDFRNPHLGPASKDFSWAECDVSWASKDRPKTVGAGQLISMLATMPAVKGLASDKAGLDWADTVIMLQPCGRSSALELGYGIGRGKDTMAYLVDGQEPELVIRMADILVRDYGSMLLHLADPRPFKSQ